MFGLPALPAWSDLHPAVIHFPIALLLVAPLFVVAGALLHARGRMLLVAALALMILGTGGAWLAVATGEAASDVAESRPGLKAAVEQHEDLAETTRAVFTALTVLFALIVALPPLIRKANVLTTTVAPLLFLIAYAAGALLLANTAHQGGQLVHQTGASPAISAPVEHDD